MRRTQLYIDDSLFRLLRIISREKKTTISDLVRKALSKVYGHNYSPAKRLKALQAVSGIWKDRADLSSTEDYVRWRRKDTRARRLGLDP